METLYNQATPPAGKWSGDISMNVPGVRERLEALLRAQLGRLAEWESVRNYVSRDGMADDELRNLDHFQAGEKLAINELKNHIANLRYLLESPEFYAEVAA